jgi:hypothetical protein
MDAFLYMYSQYCIKRSPLGQGRSGLCKTGDLLKEVEFTCNLQDRIRKT